MTYRGKEEEPMRTMGNLGSIHLYWWWWCSSNKEARRKMEKANGRQKALKFKAVTKTHNDPIFIFAAADRWDEPWTLESHSSVALTSQMQHFPSQNFRFNIPNGLPSSVAETYRHAILAALNNARSQRALKKKKKSSGCLPAEIKLWETFPG